MQIKRWGALLGAILPGSLFVFLLTLVALVPRTAAQTAFRPVSPAQPTEWADPVVLWPELWADPLYFTLSDDGARLTALLPHSGSSDTTRQVVVTERNGGVWSEPVVIAENGAYSDASFQWLPQKTHPVLSGDGETIAYVGYTGATYGAYVIDRAAGGGWGAPQLLNTGLPNTHYWISLSGDGNTLALSDYPFLGIQQLYVMQRVGGVWGTPVQVSATVGPHRGGGNPSLSADGARLAFIANTQVMVAERGGGGWGAPQPVTAHDSQTFMAEYPQMSGDGNAVTYWLVTLTPSGSVLVRTAQTLYIVRRQSGVWNAPQPVNAVPVLPAGVTDGPAAADRRATRIIYTRPVTTTDPGSGEVTIDSSHLEIAEWTLTGWRENRLVERNGYGNYNKWPRLTPDGRQVVFDGGIRYTVQLPVYNALWTMTTAEAPPPPPLPLSTGGLIPIGGGILYSEIDNTTYLFGPGAFGMTVQFTHTASIAPPQPPPPAGWVNVNGIGGLGRAFAATALAAETGLPVQPSQPVTVTIGYGDLDGTTAVAGSLRLWWLNAGVWQPIPTIDNPAVAEATARVAHFSQFALFGETHRLFLPVAVR